MKKFLIGVILIIPIIVVLALDVTGTIIQNTTPVNPTEIVIKNSDNVELERGDVVKIDINTTDEFIIIDVLPGITKDKTIEYEIDEDAGTGRVTLERMGETNRYRITPEAVGVTKLDIRASANVNVYQEVTFNVTTDTIETLSIFDDKGNAIGKTLDIYTPTRLVADIYPVGALDESRVVWRSKNEEVATVNDNGVISPVSHGITRILYEVYDKDGNFHSGHVDIDTTKCVAKSDTVYTSEEVTVEWIKENVALAPNHTEVELVSDGVYNLVYDDGERRQEQQISVSECGTDDFCFYDDVDKVYTNNGPYRTGLKYLESGTVIDGEITYESSRPEVMTVSSDGTLIPLKAGETTIRATYNGAHIDKTYTVRERPATFELELGSADAKLGIQLKRTWGLYWANENPNGGGYELTNTFNFGLYEDAGTFDVKWTVDNEEYATVTPTGENNDVEITFYESAAGNSVTVTATLLVDNRCIDSVKRSFTFSFQQKAKSANVYDYSQMKSVMNALEYDIVMQNDIYADSRNSIYSSIYGNGFTFDYTEASKLKQEHYWRLLSPKWGPLYINDTYDHYTYGEGDMVLEDIVIKGAETLEEASDTGGMIDFNEFKAPIIIRYCQVYNTTEGLDIRKCENALIEGCIFGDNYVASLTLGYREDYEGNIILRNNVFKQSSGACVQIFSDKVTNASINKPLKVNISVEGFMDIYNWKERSEMETIFSKMLLTRIGADIIPEVILDSLTDMISELVMPVLNSDAFSGMYYQYGGKEYVNFGIFGMGLMSIAEVDRVTIADSARLQAINLPFKDENGKPIGGLSGIETLVQSIMNGQGVYNMSISHPCYLVCTDFSSGDPYIEPGDPVPNSRDLYSDLVNGRNV